MPSTYYVCDSTCHTFVVGYAPKDTQSVGKKHAFWTTLERVVKEVPEHEQLFVLLVEGGSWGVRSARFVVPPAEILSTTMVSNSFHFLPIMGLHYPVKYFVRFLVPPPKTQFRIRSTGEAKNVLTTFSRDNETENSCAMLLCTPNRHSCLSRTTTLSKHMM